MTKQTKKTAIIISVILVIGIISYFVFFRKKKTEAELEEENKNTTGVKTSGKNDEFPLKKGSYGNRVLNLQKYLNGQTKAPLSFIKEDKDFGKETEDRLYLLSKAKQVTGAAYNVSVLPFISGNTEYNFIPINNQVNPSEPLIPLIFNPKK